MDFRATAVIKQQQGLTVLVNLTMVCSYRSYCINLPVALVDCQVYGYTSRLHHVCEGGYVAMHEIDLYGVERKIYCNCVYELRMGGTPEKLKKVGHITV